MSSADRARTEQRLSMRGWADGESVSGRRSLAI